MSEFPISLSSCEFVCSAGIYRTHTLFEIIYFILFAATSCWFYPVKKSWSKHKRQEVSQRVVLELFSLIWTTFKSNFSLHPNPALNIPGFLKKNAENLESIRCCIASIVCKTKWFGLKKEKKNFQKKTTSRWTLLQRYRCYWKIIRFITFGLKDLKVSYFPRI